MALFLLLGLAARFFAQLLLLVLQVVELFPVFLFALLFGDFGETERLVVELSVLNCVVLAFVRHR